MIHCFISELLSANCNYFVFFYVVLIWLPYANINLSLFSFILLLLRNYSLDFDTSYFIISCNPRFIVITEHQKQHLFPKQTNSSVCNVRFGEWSDHQTHSVEERERSEVIPAPSSAETTSGLRLTIKYRHLTRRRCLARFEWRYIARQAFILEGLLARWI